MVVQSALKKYQPIWEEFERVWHIKAIDFLSFRQWKTQQEMNLQRERGASIKGESLEKFIRMIETAIPQKDLQSIRSDVLVQLNTFRQIKWVGKSEDATSEGISLSKENSPNILINCINRNINS